MTVLLEVHDLVKHYHLPRASVFAPAPVVEALRGVSFTVRAGRSLGIVGESGSGKSTLARLVMALEAPTSGCVSLLGRDLNALPPTELIAARRDFQMVFQDPYGSLDPRQRVARIVAEPLIGGDQAYARQPVVLDEVAHLQQRVGHAGPNSPTRKQRASCAGPTFTAAGGAARQASTTHAQRSANGQPAGMSTSSGTRPGIVTSRGLRPFTRAVPRRGRAANRPRVYGCARCAKTSVVGPDSTTVPPYITSRFATMRAITPRSWLIISSAMPLPSTSSRIRSRISP